MTTNYYNFEIPTNFDHDVHCATQNITEWFTCTNKCLEIEFDSNQVTCDEHTLPLTKISAKICTCYIPEYI